jgi:hypothetical protein
VIHDACMVSHIDLSLRVSFDWPAVRESFRLRTKVRKMNDKDPCTGSRDWRQFLLRCRRPIHAIRTGSDQSDHSSRWWLWTWLSSWSIWWLPSQWLLRRRVLRRGDGSARRGGGGSPSDRRPVPSSLQCLPMLGGLLTDFEGNHSKWLVASRLGAIGPGTLRNSVR